MTPFTTYLAFINGEPLETAMTAIIIDKDAVSKIEAANLRAGSWGGNEAVCMMSAMVPGAQSVTDCVTAGWPEWLASLNVSLFDADVGADDESAARIEFARAVAQAVSRPVDYDRARDFFLIARLDSGEHSALKSMRKNPVDADWWRSCETAIIDVVALFRRRASGENVSEEMTTAAAAAAADAAADAAARAAARADLLAALSAATVPA